MTETEPAPETIVEDPIITIDDAIRAGHCATGIYRWCRDNGFDFRTFRNEGLRASRVIELNDAFGNQVVARALARRETP